MRTDDLIVSLSADLKPVSSYGAVIRLALGLGTGLLLSYALMYALLGLRPDLTAASGTAAFWIKLTYTLTLAIGGVIATNHIGYPLGRSRLGICIMVLTVSVIAVLAFARLSDATPQEYRALLLGHTVTVCSLNIALLSLPLLLAFLWFLKGMAPANSIHAGAVAGLASGALASVIYSFHCDESAVPFIAIWYTSGALFAGAIGALAGKLFIRW